MPAHKKLKTGGYSVYQTQFGGDPTFYVATLVATFAEIDKGPAQTRAFGQAAAARGQQKLAGVVTHVERTVIREMPGLSAPARPMSQTRWRFHRRGAGPSWAAPHPPVSCYQTHSI